MMAAVKTARDWAHKRHTAYEGNGDDIWLCTAHEALDGTKHYFGVKAVQVTVRRGFHGPMSTR